MSETIAGASVPHLGPLCWAGAPTPQMPQVLANSSHPHSSQGELSFSEEYHLGWRWLEPIPGLGKLLVAKDGLRSTWGNSYSRAS